MFHGKQQVSADQRSNEQLRSDRKRGHQIDLREVNAPLDQIAAGVKVSSPGWWSNSGTSSTIAELRDGPLKLARRAGSHMWAASMRSRSASHVEQPMVTKHWGQMESMVPSLFMRCGKSKCTKWFKGILGGRSKFVRNYILPLDYRSNCCNVTGENPGIAAWIPSDVDFC
jgi:hypothetical protein